MHPASPNDAGEEVPIEIVNTPAVVESTLKAGPNQIAPGTKPITFQAGDGPSVTLTKQLKPPENTAVEDCLRIRRPSAGPETAWGVAGTCGAGVLQVFHYPHPDSEADASVYYAWGDVPRGTAYVTFDSNALRAWQRPKHDTVVFPVQGEPVDAVVRAVGDNGELLGEVQVSKSFNGSRTPLPQSQAWNEPVGLTLAERCEVAPLSALGFGDGPTMLVGDAATGTPVEFDKRDYCRQQAALSPDPAGDIVGRVYVSNGRVTAEYFEAVRTSSAVTPGAPIPFDEAQRRIAAQHEARRF